MKYSTHTSMFHTKCYVIIENSLSKFELSIDMRIQPRFHFSKDFPSRFQKVPQLRKVLCRRKLNQPGFKVRSIILIAFFICQESQNTCELDICVFFLELYRKIIFIRSTIILFTSDIIMNSNILLNSIGCMIWIIPIFCRMINIVS